MYSCAFVHRSVTDSGIGFGFDQMMSCRRYQPSACRAKATRQGMPTRSFGFRPLLIFELPICTRPRDSSPYGLIICPPVPFRFRPGWLCVYESTRFSHSVPSSRSTRRTSRSISTVCSTYISGVGSNPKFPLHAAHFLHCCCCCCCCCCGTLLPAFE